MTNRSFSKLTLSPRHHASTGMSSCPIVLSLYVFPIIFFTSSLLTRRTSPSFFSWTQLPLPLISSSFIFFFQQFFRIISASPPYAFFLREEISIYVFDDLDMKHVSACFFSLLRYPEHFQSFSSFPSLRTAACKPLLLLKSLQS